MSREKQKNKGDNRHFCHTLSTLGKNNLLMKNNLKEECTNDPPTHQDIFRIDRAVIQG